MPRKTNLERPNRGRNRSRSGSSETRTPRPKPKIDFTLDTLEHHNVNLLRSFTTDAGRILPRKYTGLPARYQRRLTQVIKRARQMLLVK
jgi:small subunit ribosomal protein S18